MEKLVVAAVQMKMRLPATVEEFREDMKRFVRSAEGKRARLVIFPELAGNMLAPAMLRDLRTNLVRHAEQGKKRTANPWMRVRGGVAGWLAGMLKADLRANAAGLLDVNGQEIWATYCEVFSGLAKEFQVTLVAPSAYLPSQAQVVTVAPEASAASDGNVASEGFADSDGPTKSENIASTPATIVNQCAVFGADGTLVGTQSKVLGYVEDEDIAQRGRMWEVIPTDAGRLGIMLGSDVLYPEVGRLLAYQDAEILVLQGACPSTALFNKTRSGILARMQDNQLYAAASYVAGESVLRRGGGQPYLGRSALFAPQELTPRYNGVLVEMGSTQVEGVVSAEWDFAALKRLWKESDTPIRRGRGGEEVTTLIAALYTQLRALPSPAEMETLALPDVGVVTLEGSETVEGIELDDLAVVASVRSGWPLRQGSAGEDEDDTGPGDLTDLSTVKVEEVEVEEVEWPPRSYADAPGNGAIRRDDETDEMDAVERESSE